MKSFLVTYTAMRDAGRARKSILNYTTIVPAQRTIGGITNALAQAKTQAILTGLEDGRVSAISFRIPTEFGLMTFRLPARVEAVYRVLCQSREIPAKLRTHDQAARVAWRIVKDWPEARLARVRAGLVDLKPVFLALRARQHALHERVRSQGFSGLRSGDGPKPGA